jgi:hypothetical protein
MDRNTAILIAATTIMLTLIGGLYFAPAPAGRTITEPTFDTSDIRYKLQQDEIKARKKNKGRKPPPPDSEPEFTSDNEAPPIDETVDDTAEEPPIE